MEPLLIILVVLVVLALGVVLWGVGAYNGFVKSRNLIQESWRQIDVELNRRYELIPNPGEDFPYERIGIPRDYRWQKGVETGPVYPWRDKAIWGLTGRITRHVLSLLDEERK